MKFYPVLEPVIGQKEKEYINDCINSGWISSNGKYVKQFEEAFAKWNGVKYADAVCNGTVSLHLILLALGIKPGDEVIVPDCTYVATANSVLYVGAKPIFIDCKEDTLNIDPLKIEEKITRNTRAIIVVHLFGNPCDMGTIMGIARKHKLLVIEDAAEAHGALFRNKMVGTFGIANSYSFFGNKIMTTGEGGAVVTNSKKVHRIISLLKNQGQNPKHRKYYHDCLAYNYRLTNLQAAVGIGQLEQIDRFLETKRNINSWYREFLSPLVEKGIINFQEATPNSAPSWWVTTILINTVAVNKLAVQLRAASIDTRPCFYPMHKQPHLKQTGNFPKSDRVAKSGMIVPSSSSLAKNDVEVISKVLTELLTKKNK
ncbi:MAG: DegT/DnrJ/EryC1/StrS family aminotransferase [Candidatus Vogelbacteria bacterium]|nr:DegT/DnrJ/EryC1/StrS family aminotransferase [Candidatus Vogelbacteria bacterium]